LYAYYVEYAYDDALEAFNKALSRTPNDDEVMLYCAAVKRRQGLWQESRTLFSQASQLNPRSTNLLYNASMTSIYLREWAEAAAYLESIVALEPDAGFWRGELAFINLDLTGDLESVAADLERVAGEFPAADLMEHQWYLAVFLRDFEKADSLLSHDRPSSFYPTYLYHALTKEYLGQHETARLYYDSLLTAANENLSDSPDEISTYYNKGQALIGLGRVEEGLDAVRMAVDLVPIEKDAMNGVQALQNLMESYARAEMPDETLDLMEQLLSTPSYLSVAFLRYDPVYDFLRDEPRFKAILKADTKVSS